MNLNKFGTRAFVATVLTLFALPLATYALVSYPAGSLLQPSDVATTTIRDYAVSPSKIASGLNFTMHGLTLTNATTTNATTTNLVVLNATTTFNGVKIGWPSADGANGATLTTNGSGSLSWASPASTRLASSFTALAGVNTGDAVRVTTDSIVFDATSTGSVAGGTTSVTVSHTISGSNRVLVVQVWNGNNGGITSATFNGSAMTLVDSFTDASNDSMYQYDVVAPATGAHNIVITRTTTTGTLVVTAASYNGVAQTGTIDSFSHNSGSSITSLTCTDTVVGTNTWSVMAAFSNGSNITAGTNSSLIGTAVVGVNAQYDSSNVEPTVSAGSFGMTVTSVSAVMDCAMLTLSPLGTTGVRKADAGVSARANGFIGFANATTSVGSSVEVNTAGSISLFTGLTAGAQYYLSNTAGALSSSAGTVTRKIGIGTAATDLLITNIW